MRHPAKVAYDKKRNNSPGGAAYKRNWYRRNKWRYQDTCPTCNGVKNKRAKQCKECSRVSR